MDLDWLNNIDAEPTDDMIGFETPETDESVWLKSRLGMITGSNFGKLVVTDKKGGYKLSTSLTTQNLIYKIAWERLLKSGNISNGLGRLSISSKAMEHGTDYEGAAIKKFQEVTGLQVDTSQNFVQLDDWIGGTPDGLIGDDMMIEVKCPWNGGNHLQSLLTGEVYNTDYIYQMQGYMWITGRKLCKFVTYDPDLIDELQINIIDVPRDEEIIKGISLVMESVKEKIQFILNSDKLNLNK